MENNTYNKMYKCNTYKKWVLINDKYVNYTPHLSSIARCAQCRSPAILNFIHDEDGDYYGPLEHNNCSGTYYYLCVKYRAHKIVANDINDTESESDLE